MTMHVSRTLVLGVSLLTAMCSFPQIRAQSPSSAEELPPPASTEEPTAELTEGDQAGVLQGTQSILNRQSDRASEAPTPVQDADRQQTGVPLIAPPNLPDFEWIVQGPVHEAFGVPTDETSTVRGRLADSRSYSSWKIAVSSSIAPTTPP